MHQQIEFLLSKRLSFYSGAILAVAFGIFAGAHWAGFQKTDQWALLLFCFSEALTAFFLIFRTSPDTVSNNLFDWLVGVAGTFAPLCFRPSSWGLASSGEYALIAGVIIQVAGLLSLNRSIAVVAAKRKLKTGGLYRFVRHPLYASYFLTFSGYALMNSSAANLAIYLVTMTLLLIRLFREEQHLALDSMYREYMQKVTYRIIPFVF